MARLLPRSLSPSASHDTDPRVIGLDDDAADDLLNAMSSETARKLLGAIHDEPAAPSELAEQVGTSLQNAQYHLNNLADAGAIEVVDTVYSEKGREMKIYAPADEPLVVVAADQEQTKGLRESLATLLAGAGALAVVSLLIQAVFRGFPNVLTFMGGTGGAERGEQVGAMDAATPTPQAAGGGMGLEFLAEPGVLFFLGGLAVLFGILILQARR